MDANYLKSDISKILLHFGHRNQKIKAIEEMGELITALARNLGDKNTNLVVENVIEEIADVEILLEQLHLIFDHNSAFINLVKNRKVKRTIDFINSLDETFIPKT